MEDILTVGREYAACRHAVGRAGKQKVDGDHRAALDDQRRQNDQHRYDQQYRHQQEQQLIQLLYPPVASVEFGCLEHVTYPLRTPRTTRSAVRLMMKVITNRKMPIVNSAW